MGKRNSFKMLDGKFEGMRPCGSPMCSHEDNINVDIGTGCEVQVSQDRVQL
jgi:hypothetical protein